MDNKVGHKQALLRKKRTTTQQRGGGTNLHVIETSKPEVSLLLRNCAPQSNETLKEEKSKQGQNGARQDCYCLES